MTIVVDIAANKETKVDREIPFEDDKIVQSMVYRIKSSCSANLRLQETVIVTRVDGETKPLSV